MQCIDASTMSYKLALTGDLPGADAKNADTDGHCDTQFAAGLPSDVWHRIFQLVPHNDLVYSLRLACKSINALLSGYTAINLFEAVPAQVFYERWAARDALRGLDNTAREFLWRATVCSGVVENTDLLLSRADYYPGEPPMPLSYHPDVTNAASYGHIDMLEWLLQMLGTAQLNHSVLDRAVESGHLPMCQWILLHHGEQTYTRPRDSCYTRRTYTIWCGYHMGTAARKGHERLLDWLLQLHRSDPERYPVLNQPSRCTRFRPGLVSRQCNAQGLVKGAATGCSLATMQSLCDEYIPHILFVPGGKEAEGGSSCPLLLQLSKQRQLIGALLEAAAASPTPDWQDKVGWLLHAHWPGGGSAPGSSGGGGGGARLLLPPEVCTAAAGLPSPGALPRLLWLQARGFPLRPLDVLLQVLCVTGDGAVLQHLLDRHDMGRVLEQWQQQQQEGEELTADGDGERGSDEGGRRGAGASVHLTAAWLLAALCNQEQPGAGGSSSTSSSGGWRNRALSAAVRAAARRGQLDVLEVLSRIEPDANPDVRVPELELSSRGRRGRCVPCGLTLIGHVVELIGDEEELFRVLHWLHDNGRWWPLDVHGEPYGRWSSVVVQGRLPSAAAVNWWLRDQGFEVLDENVSWGLGQGGGYGGRSRGYSTHAGRGLCRTGQGQVVAVHLLLWIALLFETPRMSLFP